VPKTPPSKKKIRSFSGTTRSRAVLKRGDWYRTRTLSGPVELLGWSESKAYVNHCTWGAYIMTLVRMDKKYEIFTVEELRKAHL